MMNTKTYSIEEAKRLIGEIVGYSEWITVDQTMINQFADVTLDHQFIHVDEEKAKEAPFGGTIAHGFLSLSLLSHFAGTGCAIHLKDLKMGVNYGLNKVRFLNPVRSGSNIRARSRLLAMDQRSDDQYLFTQRYTVEIEGEKSPALVAEWLTLAVV